MEPNEFTWVDSVPVRPARRKRIAVREYEWKREAPLAGEPAVLSARFWINNTELMAILVEETTVAHGSSTERVTHWQPRMRIGGRSYLLSVGAAAQDATA